MLDQQTIVKSSRRVSDYFRYYFYSLVLLSLLLLLTLTTTFAVLFSYEKSSTSFLAAHSSLPPYRSLPSSSRSFSPRKCACALETSSINPVTANRRFRDDANNYNMLVYFSCTFFLFVCSIKYASGSRKGRRYRILCCRQTEK